MRKLSRSQPDFKTGRRAPPKLTVYRLVRGRWVVEQTSALRLLFSDLPGTPAELSGPVVLVGAHCGYRVFNAAIHELLDRVEGNLLPAPADHMADLEDEPGAEPEDAA